MRTYRVVAIVAACCSPFLSCGGDDDAAGGAGGAAGGTGGSSTGGTAGGGAADAAATDAGPVELVTSLSYGCCAAIAVDASNLYLLGWVSPLAISPDKLWKVPLQGGTPTVVAQGVAWFHRWLGLDTDSVYFTTSTSVMKAPKIGGPAVELTPSPGAPLGAVDSTHVYWVEVPMTPSVTALAIKSVPLSGGTPTTLATLSVGDGGDETPSDVAVDATNVYWTTYEGSVMRVSVSGGTPALLAVAGKTSDIAADGTNVYWANSEYGTIMMVAKSGGSPKLLSSQAVVGNGAGSAIAVDGSHVYFTNSSLGSVSRVSVSGGATELLAAGSASGAIALGPKTVYWADNNAIYKRPK